MDVNTLTFTVNGIERKFLVGNDGMEGMIPPHEKLSTTLRERFNLTGAKEVCEQGACGACTVLMDDKPVNSCMILTCDCDGKKIVTIEGLEDPITGELDPLQQAFIDFYAFQCGFCTPGIIMAAKGLLLQNPHPTEEEVKEGLAGNFCRCISQYHAIDAVLKVAGNYKPACPEVSDL